jgi:TPP-dependent pyruvate/acetoin dehydrogenase alpha subunit
MNESFFNRLEEKTHVNKDTIIGLARKLQEGNFKDEKTLKEIIRELSDITGKEVSEEKEKKIIDAIVNDKVPDNVDKYI